MNLPKSELVEGIHYYVKDGYRVFTEVYHLLRGFCCGNKCKHCPYTEQIKGNTVVKEK